MDNETRVTEFILLGLSTDPHLQIFLFVVFLIIYLVTLFGNLIILIAIRVNPHLHTPMYVFLSHLAFINIALSSVIVPKMLDNFLRERKAISLPQCFTQVFFVMLFGVGEGLLLSVMAYDRYTAICHPLHYVAIMNKRVCSALVCSAMFPAFICALVNTLLLTTLHFCGANVIRHFSCEAPQLFKISCSNTFKNELVIFGFASVLGSGSLLITLASYVHIIFAVLRLHSTEGKRKAFSTCSSHLTVVVLYYLAVLFRYLKPTSTALQDQEMAPSVVYLIVTPMLNPIIYSLRNQEVKRTFINIVHGKLPSGNE